MCFHVLLGISDEVSQVNAVQLRNAYEEYSFQKMTKIHDDKR